jgi:hypothetical protein
MKEFFSLDFVGKRVSHAAVAARLAAIVFLYYIRPDCPTLVLDKGLQSLERLWSDDDDMMITQFLEISS